jgi:hypothetical protein
LYVEDRPSLVPGEGHGRPLVNARPAEIPDRRAPQIVDQLTRAAGRLASLSPRLAEGPERAPVVAGEEPPRPVREGLLALADYEA